MGRIKDKFTLYQVELRSLSTFILATRRGGEGRGGKGRRKVTLWQSWRGVRDERRERRRGGREGEKEEMRGGREGEEGEREKRERGRGGRRGRGGGGMKKAMDCFTVNSLWQSVSWAWDQSEELWCGVDKVEDLRDEEEEHGLAEVAEDGNHRKCHASKVAVCVTNKHSGGVPVGGGGCVYVCAGQTKPLACAPDLPVWGNSLEQHFLYPPPSRVLQERIKTGG